MISLLHHYLERAATGSPDGVAVVDRERSVTYRELEVRSDQLAALLGDLGVRRGDRVALYLTKSIESIVAIYGTLKAGAAYVPLDPGAPVARLAYILGNCDVRCVLSGAEMATKWSALVAETPVKTVVVLNAPEVERERHPAGVTTLGAAALDAFSNTSSQPTISVDLAYILYTSGSTGVPKGVMLSHRNGLAFVDWAVEEFGVGADDRLSNHAPHHFDLSVFDIFAAASAGATLVLVPPKMSMFPIEVARLIDDSAITVWYSVPSILSMLLERGGLEQGAFPRLRTILFAGEVFPTKYLRALMGLLPHVRFCNLYGPTETNVCTWYDVPPLPDDQTAAIPVGKAIADVEAFAVDENGRRIEAGAVGELYVRGLTVMQGYWGDADRTARSLVVDPAAPTVDRAYRTGDLVREMPDGNFEFLGRRDSQIKSRGYRIELGDIESALYASPLVVECAVVAVPDDLITNRIEAFVVVRDDATTSDLTKICADRIPRYMIPERFELRAGLPKTSTGKIDRQALAREAAGGGST